MEEPKAELWPLHRSRPFDPRRKRGDVTIELGRGRRVRVGKRHRHRGAGPHSRCRAGPSMILVPAGVTVGRQRGYWRDPSLTDSLKAF